jgi:acid phosphatase family membrane protein YuiD
MQVLISALAAWFVAQLIKVIITAVKRKKLDLYILVESGGMPSSHTALVAGLTTSVAMTEGFNALFAICLIFSLVVMYDSAGVRRSVGQQAKKINQLLDDFYESNNQDIQLGEKLAEILGHTPLEVLAGLILGVALALVLGVAF